MYLTALDLGSSEIKALLLESDRNGRMILSGVFKKPSAGIRRGEIISAEDAVGPLRELFKEIRKTNKSALRNIFVDVGGGMVKLQHSKGIVAVSRADNEIYHEDVERVIKASQAINIGSNRMILHTLTREFVVDTIAGVIDPLGMFGNRLEVNSLIIDAFRASVHAVTKCVDAAGGEVAGLIYAPLAAGQSVLTKNQRDLGVVLIDIGFGTTGIAVYEEDVLLETKTIGIGAGHITNDLAIGLRSSVKVAEMVKFSFGYALSREISLKEKIDLSEIDKGLHQAVSRRFIAEIIEVRLAEIFELVNNELKRIGKMGKLPAGVVLAGGGAKIAGIVELAKRELKLPVQIGIPELKGVVIENRGVRDELEDPAYAVAAGLILWGMGESEKRMGWLDSKKRLSISRFLKYFLP